MVSLYSSFNMICADYNDIVSNIGQKYNGRRNTAVISQYKGHPVFRTGGQRPWKTSIMVVWDLCGDFKTIIGACRVEGVWATLDRVRGELLMKGNTAV